MSYLSSTKTLAVSFMVILDPQIQDLTLANNYLNKFNVIIGSQNTFDNMKLLNESSSNSASLPRISNFASNII
jgi:hypothetical protein